MIGYVIFVNRWEKNLVGSQYPPVVYELEQSGQGGLVGVGIGEGVDEEHPATLDELIVVTIAIHSYSILIDWTREDEGGMGRMERFVGMENLG